jgi:hypothetical protein
MASHRTHGRAAAGPRESAKPHRSRIVSSSPKSPFSSSPEVKDHRSLRTFQLFNPCFEICARLREMHGWQGFRPTPYRPESWAGLFRSHQSRTREGHQGEKPSEPAETFLRASGWRLLWSRIDICVLENLRCLARVRLLTAGRL